MENTIRLHNGVEMPRIGYGVYQISPSQTERCVLDALSVGYRSIDTAQCYYNEAEVGKAIRSSGIARNEVFVTTKLWGGQGYADTVRSIDQSLRHLDMDYIDLLLIHEPSGDYKEIYRAMENALHNGKLRAIGVANFLDDTFVDLVENCEIMPMVNQIETHPFRQQTEMQGLCRKCGTVLEAWSPLACGKNGIFHNRLLTSIADAHGKSVVQVVLRWLYQRDIIIIPKSTHRERMIENLSIFDFSLTDEEMSLIATLDRDKSLFNWW